MSRSSLDVPSLTPVAPVNAAATYEQSSHKRRFRDKGSGAGAGKDGDDAEEQNLAKTEKGAEDAAENNNKFERAAVLYHRHIPRFIARLRQQCRSH